MKNKNKVPKLKTPVFANLDITSSCNQKCIFCAVSPNRDYNFRKTEHFFRIIDELYNSGIFEMTLFGGEPLLHPEIEKICKYAYDSDLEVNIVTNGTLPDKCDKISRYLNTAGVSIHGFKKTHDKIVNFRNSYERALESLKIFIENGVNTSVCYTLINQNYEEAPEFVRYIFENYEGVSGCVLDRFVPKGFGVKKRKKLEVGIEKINAMLDVLDSLSKEYKKGVTTGDGLPLCLIREDLRYIVQPCQAGVLFTSVTEDGDIKLCPASRTVIGNLFVSSLEEIWNNEWYTKYRSFEWLPKRCKECDLFNVCYAGCKVSRNVEPYSYDIFLEKYVEKYEKEV